MRPSEAVSRLRADFTPLSEEVGTFNPSGGGLKDASLIKGIAPGLNDSSPVLSAEPKIGAKSCLCSRVSIQILDDRFLLILFLFFLEAILENYYGG